MLPLFASLFLVACSSSTKITGSWRTKDSGKEMTFKRYAVIALSEKHSVRAEVEADLAAVLKSSERSAQRSIDILPPSFKGREMDKDLLLDTLQNAGFDAILIVSLLDVESETRYVPGQASYLPSMRFGWYGSFWGYYSYWQPRVYQPGYYTEDKVYYIEVNLYDIASESLIWSAQSETWNPSDLHTASKEFAQKVAKQMRKDGLLNGK